MPDASILSSAQTAPPNTAPFSIEGKTAIVTGAGSGINLSFATLLLSRNCSVLFADLSLRPEAQALVSSYSTPTQGKPRAVFQETDTARKEFGGIDIVCPGAGVFDPHWSNFWHPPGSTESRDDPEGGRYASIDINILHPIRTTQLAISSFLNPPAGQDKVSPTNPKRVIIISNVAGQVANPITPLYVAGKHAMNGFIRSLTHLDSSLGIRVNGVAPGIIKTPLWTEHPEKLKLFDDGKDEWASPEEVAEAMVRLLEKGQLEGRTILEVGAGVTRRVEMLGDPGPQGRGVRISGATEEFEGVLGRLRQEGWGKSGK
ncbi:NAD(P)-binding protein [Delitschia confertaspora ATCC 74209]|uniref:NAD(P)-binding protein n=1 Tax=Delitschia confertaspora ATCC 74209 TaxID=1513339 RepID=A0A9P4JNH7_9PLEO|nr:NAD(P)-binding protein [Delitschia confertaspora ATCC 74209]